MRTPKLLLLVALLAAPARGDDPPKPVVPVARIDAPASVPAGGRLVLLAPDAVSKSPLSWSLISPKGEPYRIEGNALVVRDPVPGVTYRFALVAFGDSPPFAFDFADVPVEAPRPPPVPAPEPEPIPRPPPAPAPAPEPVGFDGHLHATLVFGLDDPSTAPLRVSTVKADLKALGCEWYVVPGSTPMAKLFAAHTASDGLPTVYVTDDAGAMRATVKAPTSKAQVLAAVAKIRGGAR